MVKFLQMLALSTCQMLRQLDQEQEKVRRYAETRIVNVAPSITESISKMNYLIIETNGLLADECNTSLG